MHSEKYIFDHKNPLVKVEFNTKKVFLPNSKSDEDDLLNKNLNILKNSFTHNRVERRCARAKAIWLEIEKLSKVIKPMHSNAHYGFQDKTGKFLYPEETLFLLEINKLELLYNDTPVSIQEGYTICLNDHKDYFKYKVFKKLALQGYKLTRNIKITHPAKKRKIANDEIASTSKKAGDSDEISNIFQKLRENGPKTNVSECFSDKNPDFYVFLPDKQDKHFPDFNLYILYEDFILDSFQGAQSNDLFAIPSDNNVSFYKFKSTEIPILGNK